MLKISTYVPCHNNEKTLPEVLAALRHQTRPAHQYIFVHERCTDRSAAIAREHGFELIEQTGAPGLAAARNIALKHATGDVLLGIDADVAVAPNYLEELKKQFASHPEVAAVGGQLAERHRESPADLWRAVHLRQDFGPGKIVNPPFLFGSNMAARISSLKKVGGWNERYITNFEDVDLCQRLRKAGFNLVYAPTCRAEHLRRDTVQSVLKTFWNWHYQGSENMFSSVAVWLSARVPMIWKRYRVCRLADLQHPILSPITLLLPWVWTVRDLRALHGTVGDIGRPADLINAAATLLTRYGADEQQVWVLKRHLENLIGGFDSHLQDDLPLRPEILNVILLTAAESIPDGNYWRICSAELERSLG